MNRIFILFNFIVINKKGRILNVKKGEVKGRLILRR